VLLAPPLFFTGSGEAVRNVKKGAVIKTMIAAGSGAAKDAVGEYIVLALGL
jgi:hypothetical protein